MNALLLINLFVWTAAGIANIWFDPNWAVAMLLNALVIMVLTIVIEKGRGWALWGGTLYFALLSILTIADQVGAIDIVVLVLSLVTMVSIAINLKKV